MLEAIIIVLFLVVVFLFIWISCAIRHQREQDAANRELIAVRRTLLERRRLAALVQQEPEVSAIATTTTTYTPTERFERIKSCLFRHKITQPDECSRSINEVLKEAVEDDSEAAIMHDSHIMVRSYNASADGSTETLGEKECIICLETFKLSDTICWAKQNDKCNHIFHEECAIEWLKNHDRCPLCRADIVVNYY